DPERTGAIGNHQRRRTLSRHTLDRAPDFRRHGPTLIREPPVDGIGRALANPAALEIHSTHARLSREADEPGVLRIAVAASEAGLLPGQRNDGTSLGRLVRQ